VKQRWRIRRDGNGRGKAAPGIRLSQTLSSPETADAGDLLDLRESGLATVRSQTPDPNQFAKASGFENLLRGKAFGGMGVPMDFHHPLLDLPSLVVDKRLPCIGIVPIARREFLKYSSMGIKY